MKKFLPKTSKGFTLVELLVVISIIAILAVIGLVVFSGVQKNARMAKRISDLKAISLALEAYYNDPVNNFKYPCSDPAACASNIPSSECVGQAGWRGDLLPNDVIFGLVPNYLAEFPSDPEMNKASNNACYFYRSNGTDYKIADWNITEITTADLQAYPSLWDPRRGDHPNVTCTGITLDSGRRFAIYSSNGPSVFGGQIGAACW